MADNQSPTFDSYLGGEEILPASVNVQEFVKNRVEEIVMLTEALKECPFRGQVFQRLPKHMRRRQMSHHIKRLPRRLRNASILSGKEETPSAPKRPNRKYRRRPRNLLAAYSRRQRENIWLETHIWHAKRFCMTKKWGYILPEKCRNKSFRACYRAAAKHCFLTDISYYNCIELIGDEIELLEGLQQCASSDCGLTFAAKMFINGSREGSLTLYHPNAYPFHVIGPISFLWRPVEEKESFRTIWIFTHPLYHDEIVDVFKYLFGLTKVKTAQKKKEENISKNKELMKLETKNVPFSEIPKYKNRSGSIVMHLLKDSINRFRLSGPLSLAVISSAFKCNALELQNSSQMEIENIIKGGKRSYSESFGSIKTSNSKRSKKDSGVVQNDDSLWWQNFYDNEFHKKCLERQETFYNKLSQFSTPSDLPAKMVFSLVVRDPRLTIPTKRVKSTPNLQAPSSYYTTIESELSYSPLWKSQIRDIVAEKKLTTAEINQARSELIVPGSDLCNSLEDNKQERIPIIIIQRPGMGASELESDNNDLGSGFDILVPAGWAMPIWLSLVYRGARTGGLREMEYLLLESKELSQYIQPDSLKGDEEKRATFNLLKEKYFDMPHSARIDYKANGFTSPFFPLWELLLVEWGVYEDYRAVEMRNPTDQERFNLAKMSYRQLMISALDRRPEVCVLRDRKKLMQLSDLFNNLLKQLKTGSQCKFSHSFKEEELDRLVPVSIESLDRGAPMDLALLYLPSVEDLLTFKEPKRKPIIQNKLINWVDSERKVIMSDHKLQLKTIKNRRKAKRRKMRELKQNTSTGPGNIKTNFDDERLARKKHSEEDLWLDPPDSIEYFIHDCAKTAFGYVVHGGFSFSKGLGAGLGYVAFRGLLHFLKMCYENQTEPLVLFRNTKSNVYRFGHIKICI